MEHPRGQVGATLVAAVLATACYAYQPMTRPTPKAGTEVRATVSTPFNLQVGDVTIQDIDRVEGLVQYASGDSLLVSGSWLYTQLGSRYAANGSVLFIDRPRLKVLEVRRLSPARTGLASVATVGIVAALFAGVQQALGGGSGSGASGGEAH